MSYTKDMSDDDQAHLFEDDNVEPVPKRKTHNVSKQASIRDSTGEYQLRYVLCEQLSQIYKIKFEELSGLSSEEIQAISKDMFDETEDTRLTNKEMQTKFREIVARYKTTRSNKETTPQKNPFSHNADLRTEYEQSLRGHFSRTIPSIEPYMDPRQSASERVKDAFGKQFEKLAQTLSAIAMKRGVYSALYFVAGRSILKSESTRQEYLFHRLLWYDMCNRGVMRTIQLTCPAHIGSVFDKVTQIGKDALETASDDVMRHVSRDRMMKWAMEGMETGSNEKDEPADWLPFESTTSTSLTRAVWDAAEITGREEDEREKITISHVYGQGEEGHRDAMRVTLSSYNRSLRREINRSRNTRRIIEKIRAYVNKHGDDDRHHMLTMASDTNQCIDRIFEVVRIAADRRRMIEEAIRSTASVNVGMVNKAAQEVENVVNRISKTDEILEEKSDPKVGPGVDPRGSAPSTPKRGSTGVGVQFLVSLLSDICEKRAGNEAPAQSAGGASGGKKKRGRDENTLTSGMCADEFLAKHRGRAARAVTIDVVLMIVIERILVGEVRKYTNSPDADFVDYVRSMWLSTNRTAGVVRESLTRVRTDVMELVDEVASHNTVFKALTDYARRPNGRFYTDIVYRSDIQKSISCPITEISFDPYTSKEDDTRFRNVVFVMNGNSMSVQCHGSVVFVLEQIRALARIENTIFESLMSAYIDHAKEHNAAIQDPEPEPTPPDEKEEIDTASLAGHRTSSIAAGSEASTFRTFTSFVEPGDVTIDMVKRSIFSDEYLTKPRPIEPTESNMLDFYMDPDNEKAYSIIANIIESTNSELNTLFSITSSLKTQFSARRRNNH